MWSSQKHMHNNSFKLLPPKPVPSGHHPAVHNVPISLLFLPPAPIKRIISSKKKKKHCAKQKVCSPCNGTAATVGNIDEKSMNASAGSDEHRLNLLLYMYCILN